MPRPPGKYGDWEQLELWSQMMKQAKYRRRFESDMRALGRAIADKVRAHIRQQDLSWPPLSAVTVAKKGFKTIYVETSDYYNKINAQLKTGRPGGGMELTVSVRGRHPSSGMKMQTLGEMLEYGTTKMPARPLWRPTFAELPNMAEYKALIDLGAKFSFRSNVP